MVRVFRQRLKIIQIRPGPHFTRGSAYINFFQEPDLNDLWIFNTENFSQYLFLTPFLLEYTSVHYKF